MLPSGPVGWEIVLESDNPKAVDLDLYVYPMTAAGSRRTLCSSEGIEAREVCRVLPVPAEPVTIEVTPNGGDGRTEFRVTRRPLAGPRMGDTPAVAGDAITLAMGEWRPASLIEAPFDYGNASDNSGLLFRIAGESPERRRVVAVSGTGARAFHIAAFDANGKQIAESRDLAEAGYVDLLLDRAPGGAYLLVTSLQGADRFTIGAWAFGEPMPVPAGTENWTASGMQTRSYNLTLEQGETAAIELEGTRARLSVTDADGRVSTPRPQFGTAQQLAQVGDPLGNSSFVLRGVEQRRTVSLQVNVEESSLYGSPSTWRMHVHRSRREQNYRIRFGSAPFGEWREWWASPVASRSDSVPTAGLRLIQLLSPGDAAANAPNQSSRQARLPAQQSYLARLTGIPGYHLAVCTVDGQVLDISAEAVRWTWTPDLGQVLLVVFPDPFSGGAPGGPFRLELTRSIATVKE